MINVFHANIGLLLIFFPMGREAGGACVFFLIVSCYRYEQCLEVDLFLVQCCAALAPPYLFVNRILERFGLSKYLSLNLERSNEYVLISVISI